MNNVKSSLFCMIFLVMQIYCVQPKDLNISPQTTKLIEFVKQQEKSLVDLQKNKKDLMDKCVGKYVNNRERYYRYYVKRNSSIEDCKNLYKIQKELLNFDERLQSSIQNMIQNGESFSEVDIHNHTALYYAESEKIYNVLRTSGANFELIPFLYIYQWYTIPTSAALLYIIYKLYEVGYFSLERCVIYAEKVYDGTISTIDDIKKLIYADDNAKQKVEVKKSVYNIHDMQSYDTEGRTPLMNYIITQEKSLVALRINIDALWKDNNVEWGDYYAAILKHKMICDQTQINIKEMVQLGAKLDIKDIFGKTLLDYCMTREIYEILLEVGVPFQVDAWIYFNYDYFVKKFSIIAPTLAVCAFVVAYKTMNTDTISIDEKDYYFMQWARWSLK